MRNQVREKDLYPQVRVRYQVQEEVQRGVDATILQKFGKVQFKFSLDSKLEIDQVPIVEGQ